MHVPRRYSLYPLMLRMYQDCTACISLLPIFVIVLHTDTAVHYNDVTCDVHLSCTQYCLGAVGTL